MSYKSLPDGAKVFPYTVFMSYTKNVLPRNGAALVINKNKLNTNIAREYSSLVRKELLFTKMERMNLQKGIISYVVILFHIYFIYVFEL